MTQQLQIGDQTVEVETRPLNLVVQPAQSAMGPDIRYPGCVVLDSEMTAHHAEQVKVVDPEFWTVWRLFLANTSPPTPDNSTTPDDIRRGGTGARHVMGLIDLSLKLMRQGHNVVWRHPECHLHPGWAVALGDVGIWFSKWQPHQPTDSGSTR